ncbi:protein FLUORESCENT IN BLUE LIGHT, chloroplastic [Manihot esculenta]|uniref:Uncharacterized protein n=1 Tax=Manihot esculenta TaxID=3983 RepID=A0A2C9UYN4_MANES|nr:protein FLUORESCENT IN BLUE LIGHT, chloroplastic [Manihot esculenta]OAY36377.1 hypothetical protein MANES_11G016500v8 [Manihot esculenta]
MAGVIRCACFIARPYSVTSPSSDLVISGNSHLTGKSGSLLFKVEKFASSSVNASSVPSLFRHELTRGESVHLRPAVQGEVVQVSPICEKFFEELSAHQGILKCRSSALAFFVTNALMWIAPFEALAETCEADNSFFNMPLLLFVALIGATVGGLLARQRRGELQRLNEQLRQINAALRRQAKIESYAPSLSYAPVGSRIAENEVIVDPRKQELISRLKTGKNFLRNQDPEKAFVEFKTALELAQSLKDPIEEKKAARGLGASLQRQGKYREAIKYHSLVLAISEREGESSGNTEAYGAIADCYTELGDLERAGKFYDKYIARLETD